MKQQERLNHRDGEVPASHLRSERAVQIDDQWFFSTREGIDIGPYATHHDAQSAAADFATMLKGVTDPEIARQFAIREFMLLRWSQRTGGSTGR